jgi:hydrogenase maturation protein HypF
MREAVTKVVCFYGVVQGVGFRPTVAVLAAENNMVGEVSNVGGFVRLIVTDTPERIDAFVSFICARKPRSSEILHVESREIDFVRFDDFTITASSIEDDVAAAVPADIAICDNCLAEFRDPSNPRYLHPFISCTDCGPRFTIMERLPYDRDTTTMDEFPMCEFCDGEYFDEGGRRYHAQTISCHECGPQAIWMDCRASLAMTDTKVTTDSETTTNTVIARSEATVDTMTTLPSPCHCGLDPQSSASPVIARSEATAATMTTLPSPRHCGLDPQSSASPVIVRSEATADTMTTLPSPRHCGLDPQSSASPVIVSEARQSIADIEMAIRCLLDEGVIALKGVGGYYLVCSPFSFDAVRTLRQIKRREAKPFAVMFSSVDEVRKYCDVSPAEADLLESSKRPIVLCNKAQAVDENVDNFVSGVCDESMYIGAFLPSLGLQYLLLDELGPLIMTSCNPSELPIIKDDDSMFAFAESHAAELGGVLYHTRKIVTAMDDSVARVIDGKPQLIRRAKGYAPLPIYLKEKGLPRFARNDKRVFAAGADLKSSFALSKGRFIYPSRFIGDLGSVEQMDEYKAELARMEEFFSVEPDLIVCDMHPGYESVRFAEGLDCGSEAAMTLSQQTMTLSQQTATLPQQTTTLSQQTATLPLETMTLSPETTECHCGLDPQSSGTPLRGISPNILHVQHHHAHIASVMAEHRLASVIGVSFDGTGYGTDGCIWGGEILLVDGSGFERFSHLEYVNMIGGDSSMKDGWKSALSHMLDCRASLAMTGNHQHPSLRAKRGNLETIGNLEMVRTFNIDINSLIEFSEKHDTLAAYGELGDASTPLGQAAAGIRASVNTVRSSSMGRLFDAASSLLGLAHVNRYEGECAICLEAAARRAMHNHGASEADDLALAFHEQISKNILVEVLDAREETGRNDVCISGGVFQNKILTERVLALLRTNGFDVYYNESVPPNDGGVALGQVYVALMRDKF